MTYYNLPRLHGHDGMFFSHIMSFCEKNVSRQVEGLYLILYLPIYVLYIPYLVGSFNIVFFHSTRDNPSHWLSHIFQDGYCTTNQISLQIISVCILLGDWLRWGATNWVSQSHDRIWDLYYTFNHIWYIYNLHIYMYIYDLYDFYIYKISSISSCL